MGFFKDIVKSVSSNPVVGTIAGSLVGGPIGGFLGGSIPGILEDNREAREAREYAENVRREDISLQKEFAQNGIRWKVEDAIAAGLHPLAALGAGATSYQPVGVGDIGYNRAPSITDHLWDMGQNLARAALSGASRTERDAVYEQLTVERLGLQNELLRTQIAVAAKDLGPPLPSNSDMPLLTGQGNGYPTSGTITNGYVVESPLMRTHSQPGSPGQEVGAVPDFGFARTGSGGLAIIPSADVKNRIEDQIIPETAWAVRNHVVRSIAPWKFPEPDPKVYPLPIGYTRWRWNPVMQEYRPSKTKRSWRDTFLFHDVREDK